MDSFQSPHYQVNKRLLFYLGQWPLQKPRERLFFRSVALLLVGSLMLPKVIKFIECLGNFKELIECVPVLGVHALSAVKFFNCSINGKKLKKLTRRLNEDWVTRGTDHNYAILERYAERSRQLTIIYASYLYVTMGIYLLLPWVPIMLDIIVPLNEPRELIYLYKTEYFIDQDKYYFFILVHAYLTMPVSVGVIIGFDTMFAAYVHHACGIFATLGSRLENIGRGHRSDESEMAEDHIVGKDVAYEQIVECIKMHKEAVEFAGLLESSTSVCFLLVIGICMLMITLTGFMTVTSLDAPSDVLRFGVFTLSEIIHMFFLCWQGQLLMQHSEHIFIDAYNVHWYDMPTRAKRLLIVIMMRSSVPCKITAGKVYVLSLENFTTAMKTSMSYFTVLLSMQ